MNKTEWGVAAALVILSMGVAAACAGAAGEEPFTDLRLQRVADGFAAPHFLTTPPGDAQRFVVDLVGKIFVLEDDGTPRPKPFLDIGDRMITLRGSYDERGLLGLAFHPRYKENGRFFVHYSAPLRADGPKGWDNTSRISEFRVSDDPHRADPDSERIILQIDQPAFNHNGGPLAFGPDGFLYIGMGDGGHAADTGPGHPPLGHGQDVTTLLGAVLRIDVDRQPYAIPPENPLVGKKVPPDGEYSGDRVREEIWAWGLRHVWGMTFDRETGVLHAADVGQDLWEEVNRMETPGNYGWNIKEGTHWFDPDDLQRVVREGPDRGPMGEPLIDPVIEYRNPRGHGEGIGICVIGGFVYRGRAIEELRGQYVFGDWSSRVGTGTGVLLVARPPRSDSPRLKNLWPITVAQKLDHYLLGFGQDADGELYVLVSAREGPRGATGKVLKIVRDEKDE
jgi:glucose/arabinose dehydrogenase